MIIKDKNSPHTKQIYSLKYTLIINQMLKYTFIFCYIGKLLQLNKDENVHQIRKENERERERDKERQKERYIEGGRDIQREGEIRWRERERERGERDREVKGIERERE